MKKVSWYVAWALIALGCTALIAAAAGYTVLRVAEFLLDSGYRGYQISGFNLSFEFLSVVCVGIGSWVSGRIVVHVYRSSALKESRRVHFERWKN